MQNSRGWLMSLSASASRCFAATCAGIIGARVVSATFFRQSQNQRPNPISASANTTHATQIHGLGISTGGLMSRKALVAAACRAEDGSERFVLATQPPFFTRFEETPEGCAVGLVSAQLDS